MVQTNFKNYVSMPNMRITTQPRAGVPDHGGAGVLWQWLRCLGIGRTTEEVTCKLSLGSMGVLPGQKYSRARDELFTDLTAGDPGKDVESMAKFGEKYGRSRAL